MTITHAMALRNTLTDLVVDAVDAGSLNDAGAIQLWDSALSVRIANIPLANPAFGTSVNGVATLENTDVVSVDNAGTIGIMRFVDRDGNTVMDLTVTLPTASGDVTMDTVTYSIAQTIGIQNFTYAAVQ